ncbi:methyl-accepting chemotaxis protein [Vibrio xiamenensis]|nr:methyl-accepting chemotaxis protein [Vibrio xiamenensis]
MMVVTKMQQSGIEAQAARYFEAVTEVLNADRDIYQARLAQERLLGGQGTIDENTAAYKENAQQVFDRFQHYRSFLSEEPQLLTEFESFDSAFKSWTESSDKLLKYAKARNQLTESFSTLDSKFLTLRDMLDKAGERLREYAREKENDPQSNDYLERYVEAIAEILNADRDIYQARLVQQQILNGVGDFEKNKAVFEENAQQVIQRFHSYRNYLLKEPDLIAPYAKFDTLFNEWLKESNEFLTSEPAIDQALIPQELGITEQRFDIIRDMLDRAGERVRTHARAMEDELANKIQSFQSVATVIIVIAFAASLIVGYMMPKRITQNVESLTLRIREIAEGDGDLTQRINSAAKDELGDLANEFDGFVERLRSIISSVHDQSRALGGMTGELNSTSETTVHITQALVSASDFIVNSGDDMNRSTQNMSDVARETTSEAQNSTQLTKQGIAAVNTSHKAISALVSDIEEALIKATELEQSSEAIASVLEVIRNIAEQTNLLALNAAIEAARAGDQGRGFAVVADEVRTLATRTQQSTDEIESMIDRLKQNVNASSASIQNSRTNANTTVANFDEVIRIFDALEDSFEKVKTMAMQTEGATQEQFTLVSAINDNLGTLKEQTDGVKTVSDLIQTTSQQISQLYVELDKQVGSFKV